MKAKLAEWDRIVIEDFNKFYAALTIQKPDIKAFFNLEFEFQLGIYLRYLESKAVIVAVTDHGFKIKQSISGVILYPESDEEKALPLYKDYILSWWERAINAGFQYLSNPF